MADAADVGVIVAARNEADLLPATLASLARALPGAALWVADDASADGTGDVALAVGARLIRRRRPHGKGGNVTAAAQALLGDDAPAFVLLCDGDLGESAGELRRLVDAARGGEGDLVVAAFSRRVGGGFGLTLRVASRAIERATGFAPAAPISGQRAMRVEVLRAVLPFAPGYGMETGMTIDAIRAGYEVRELELELEHRATGRTLSGFTHRGRQLAEIWRAGRVRRRRAEP